MDRSTSAPALPGRHPRARYDVTCTIIAFNEEDRIAQCIESVRDLVSEVVVVDSGSTDRTRDISAALGARVVERAWEGYGPQKRYAEDLARHDWILNLDADEWLTEDARAELLAILSNPIPASIHGFRFRIKTVYPNASKPRLFADAHNYIRLYDRRLCRFPESLVFDEIHLPLANVAKVRAPIYHRSIRSISHLIDKNIRYFKLQREEVSKAKLGALVRMPIEPFAVFIKYYFFKRHFTGGIYGLLVASTISYVRTYRLALIGFRRARESRC